MEIAFGRGALAKEAGCNGAIASGWGAAESIGYTRCLRYLGGEGRRDGMEMVRWGTKMLGETVD